MFSGKYNCIFVHIPRVAGTSIEMALTGLDWWDTVHLPGIIDSPGFQKILEMNSGRLNIDELVKYHPKHLSAAGSALQYGPHRWNSCYKFSFVRNPWDRIVSLYFSLNDILKAAKTYADRSCWASYVLRLYKNRHYLDSRNEMVSFSKFVRCYQPMPWESSHKTQKSILQVNEPLDQVDFIGRFENLSKDVNVLFKRINAKRMNLEHVNKTRKDAYQNYYDNRSKDFVAKEYDDDIKAFHYEF
jgi:hypothetical protein